MEIGTERNTHARGGYGEGVDGLFPCFSRLCGCPRWPPNRPWALLAIRDASPTVVDLLPAVTYTKGAIGFRHSVDTLPGVRYITKFCRLDPMIGKRARE